ncbi:acyl-CoA dehydrogenase family protein [Streptomyces cyaneofuscatus]|uniref:acyl-CoA dehydrogenase family protein n=1 Tax=Streptomyces cyaneofuscatus TaxID=66883 RepID=UPI002D7987F2|nr:acyl-CoA dehydrogenase family protein [Streptomyces cyaneofuscatus]WRO14929.1 acyl-CoA dehydrogenase family protein [Streptomyces cyaneofuscatus]
MTCRGRGAPGPSPSCALTVTATDRAVQILGGEGHSREQPVERICRGAEMLTTFHDNPDTPYAMIMGEQERLLRLNSRSRKG